MKRLMGFLIALLLVTFAATPAFAQGASRGGQMCMGGSTVVEANETPDSVVLFGCGARIKSGAHVLRDVVSFGGDVVVEEGARVDRDVVVFGGNVQVAGRVGRGITLFGGRVSLEPSAVVERDVVVFGGYTDRKEGAVVRGRVDINDRFEVAPFRFAPITFPFVFGGGLAGIMASAALGLVRGVIYAIALAALGALTVVFLPAQTKQVGDVAEKSALPSLGLGCLTLLAFLPLFILLIILILTIPVALLMPFVLVIVALFGWIAVGRVIGEKVMEALKARQSWREPVIYVIVGVVLLALITALPVFGWLVGLFVGSLGIGAVILTRFGTRPYPMTYVPTTVAPVVAPSAPAKPSDPAAASSSDAGPSI